MDDSSLHRRIEALAHDALTRPPEEREAFLDKVCPTQMIKEAVRAHIAQMEGTDSTEPMPDAQAPTVPYTGADTKLMEADRDDAEDDRSDDELADARGKGLAEKPPAEEPGSSAPEAFEATRTRTDPPPSADASRRDEPSDDEPSDDEPSDDEPSDGSSPHEPTRTRTAPPPSSVSGSQMSGTDAPGDGGSDGGGSDDGLPSFDTLGASITPPAPGSSHPERIGPWRLERQIGRGGMGAVYLAERADGQFQQRAALKLIRHDLGASAQQRFLGERQILAQLQHPNIAHLLDGGVTEDGRPYFAMEYVDGTPLNTYCNENNLGVEARLQLFQQICEAVQFAHRNLIVHRDLKPGNILVTDPGTHVAAGTDPSGGSGPQVKLLDFGIAKALEGAEAVQSYTRTGEGGPMTPSYAAPEQVQGEAITTATDVYALGVVLCELLTGVLPYDVRGRPMVEAVQVIAEEEPERLSALIDAEHSEQVLSASDLSAEALKTRLQGDLEVMVRKALRKEPERRYTSAAEFGQDINRHLNGLPVEARPATTGYRLRRFIARNRPAVMGASAAVVALILGLGVAIWQGQVAATERDRAQQQAERAEAVQTFLVDMIGRAAPAVTGGEELTVREVLDEADAELATPTLQEQPQVSIEVRQTISDMYRLLDRHDASVAQAHEAYETSREAFGPDAPRTLQAAGLYGGALLSGGETEEAERLFSETVPRLASAQVDPETRFTVLASHGDVLRTQAHLDSAEVTLQQALDWHDQMASVDTLGKAGVLNSLGSVYRDQERLDEAEEMYQQALALMGDEVTGSRGPLQDDLLNSLAIVHRQRGNYDEAEQMYREALDLSTTLYGEESGVTARAVTNLSRLLHDRGQLEEADELSARAVRLHRAIYGDEDYRTGFALFSRARVQRDQDQLDAASTTAEEALNLFQEEFGAVHPHTATLNGMLTRIYINMGMFDRAEQHGTEALDAYYALADSTDANVAVMQSRLGRVYTEQGRYNEAEEHLLQALDIQTNIHENPSRAADTRARLGNLYEAWGRPGAADQFDGEDQQAEE